MGKLIISIFLFFSLLGSPCHSVSVVTNPSVHQQDISLQQLRAIYTLQQRHWPDGTPITVFRLSNSQQSLHPQFCQELLRVYPSQLEQLWDRLVFSGQAERPHSFNTPQEMLRAVAQTPGAIGYSDKKVSDDQVKFLPVKP